MAATEIRLESQNWFFDDSKPIGSPGGFGAVFAGTSPDGQSVAIKRLHLDAGLSAHRELRVASLFKGQSKRHIIPILDSGEDPNTGRYFVVMAIAEKSLQGELDAHRVFSEEEIIDILRQITEGISELDGLVHRDLKPGNLLFHDGAWKIADFGIAKFLEESTSLHTLKGCLSPQYGAPEQWNFERSETATDLYALGCIAYRLLAGCLPFEGPAQEDFYEQHVKLQPPELPGSVHPRLRTLVGMLLRKSPLARPTLQRVGQILSGMELVAQRSKSPIAEVAAKIEQERAREEAELAKKASAEHSRLQLANSGCSQLAQIFAHLRERILHEAPSTDENELGLSLGRARFPLPRSLNHVHMIPEGRFPQSRLDVVLVRTIQVNQSNPTYVWSASLLYCRPPNEHHYRWFEVGFMSVFRPREAAPFSLSDELDGANGPYYDADLALSPTMHSFQPAFGPSPIDDENEEEFIERWTTIFAAAAGGRLRYPSNLPLARDFWLRLSSYGI